MNIVHIDLSVVEWQGLFGFYEWNVEIPFTMGVWYVFCFLCLVWGLKTHLTIKKHIGMTILFVGDFVEVDTKEG